MSTDNTHKIEEKRFDEWYDTILAYDFLKLEGILHSESKLECSDTTFFIEHYTFNEDNSDIIIDDPVLHVVQVFDSSKRFVNQICIGASDQEDFVLKKKQEKNCGVFFEYYSSSVGDMKIYYLDFNSKTVSRSTFFDFEKDLFISDVTVRNGCIVSGFDPLCLEDYESFKIHESNILVDSLLRTK